MEGRSGLRGSATGSEIAQFSEAALPDECEGKRAKPANHRGVRIGAR